DGQPGSVVQGPQVAKGYNGLSHVAREHREPVRGADFWLGWDSAPNAHTHATVIAQRVQGEIYISAALVSEQTGLKQHLENVVLPWFGRHAPWVLERGGGERLHHRHDPSMNTNEGGDIDANPVLRLRRALGGSFLPGPVSWPARSGPLLAAL